VSVPGSFYAPTNAQLNEETSIGVLLTEPAETGIDGFAKLEFNPGDAAAQTINRGNALGL
jgi:hypothetical protein